MLTIKNLPDDMEVVVYKNKHGDCQLVHVGLKFLGYSYKGTAYNSPEIVKPSSHTTNLQ